MDGDCGCQQHPLTVEALAERVNALEKRAVSMSDVVTSLLMFGVLGFILYRALTGGFGGSDG